ncbi:hypothetical protein C9413_23360 [Rhizobium sp. SEMIA 4085]|nr:hypothetical protein [Rhizobium sp. SEMIA 4085]
MIAATAIVRGARAVYTVDNGFGKYLQGTDVELIIVDDLPLPPENPQRKLQLQRYPKGVLEGPRVPKRDSFFVHVH